MDKDVGGARAPNNAKSDVTENACTKCSRTPGPWYRNNRYEIGPRFRTDDQSDGMLDPIMDVWAGDNQTADADFVLKAVNSHDALVKALQHCENMLMRYEINRINGDEIADETLAIIRAALPKGTPGDTVSADGGESLSTASLNNPLTSADTGVSGER